MFRHGDDEVESGKSTGLLCDGKEEEKCGLGIELAKVGIFKECSSKTHLSRNLSLFSTWREQYRKQ